jgi:hypothetical protein
MNNWIDTYLRRAEEVSRMTIHQRGYIAAWNELEDRVQARSRQQLNDLWEACVTTKYRDGAMVICAMLPLDLAPQEMAFDS